MELQHITDRTNRPELAMYYVEKGLFKKLKDPEVKMSVPLLHADHKFWEVLIKKLKIIDVFILELLYIPRSTATCMQDVVNRMSKYNLQRTAVRNRLDRLELLGLIKLRRSSLTCVNSIPALEQNVKKLIVCCKVRFGW